VHLVGFTTGIYYDERTYERQNVFILFVPYILTADSQHLINKMRSSLYLLHRPSYNNLFILSNLDTHTQYSVVLLDKTHWST